jgi:hypothetical protein
MPVSKALFSRRCRRQGVTYQVSARGAEGDSPIFVTTMLRMVPVPQKSGQSPCAAFEARRAALDPTAYLPASQTCDLSRRHTKLINAGNHAMFLQNHMHSMQRQRAVERCVPAT